MNCRKCGTTDPADFYPYLRSKCKACKAAADLARRKPCVVCGSQLKERPHDCRELNPVPPACTCECGARFGNHRQLRDHRADHNHWMAASFAPEQPDSILT